MVRHGSRAPLVVAIYFAALGAGCVERRLTVRTDPPGALVSVNGEELGTTPVSMRFDYYGDRRMTVQAEGYNTMNLIQPIKAPWWDNLLTEFVSENMVPFTLRDEREFNYRLTPATTPETGDLLGSAEQLRQAGSTPPPRKSRGLAAWFGR